jgi:hypothetical protein
VTDQVTSLQRRFSDLLLGFNEHSDEAKVRRHYGGHPRLRDTLWGLGQCVRLGLCTGRLRALTGRNIKVEIIDGRLVAEER